MGNCMDEVVRIEAHLRLNKVLGQAGKTWNALANMKRREIADRLFQEVEATAENGAGRFTHVRHIIRTRRLRDTDFRVQIGKEASDSHMPLMKAAWPYLALFYSKPDGTFTVEAFADNYKNATK